jgi:hypothetical protein
MADNTQGTQDQAAADATATAHANGTAAATVAKLYASKADAEAARPADASKALRPFEVSKAGAVVGWINARGYDHALATVARIDGYTVSTGNTPAVTKEAAAAKVLSLSDAELAALGLSRKPAAKGKGSK